MGDVPFAGAMKPGVKLGKYEIQNQVAVGGMAIIYKAYDPSLARFVAVKQIAPHLAQDERFAERFREEARALARLSASQANIVSVYELLEQDHQLFLVMEYVEGTTLRAMMDRGAVPLQTGLGILLSTALGLKAMHVGGIVHRDLTPANIMMAADGALKITDFGLIGHSGGRTSLPMGTTKYMAPEMFTGAPVDPRADIYSLGFIAYEMLLGPEKFTQVFGDVLRDERAQQVRWMHWHSNPALRAPSVKDVQPGIPPLISKIVERMMEKEPAKRFASVDQIIRWLRRIFVMNVKGQGISESDSRNLEKEIEQDVVSPAAPAVRGRPGAPAAPAAAAQVPALVGDKTAPLAVSKWTWKRAAIWGGAIAGVLIAASVGALVFKSTMDKGRAELARDAVRKADGLYTAPSWAVAAAEFKAIVEKFGDLPKTVEYANKMRWRATAENELQDKNWGKADEAMQKANDAGADPNWLGAFQERLTTGRDVSERVAEAKRAEDAGNYQTAININIDLLGKYGDIIQTRYGLDLGAANAELQDKMGMKEYSAWILKGREAIEKANLPLALNCFQRARQIRETPEVMDHIKEVNDLIKASDLWQQADQAIKAKNWQAAADRLRDVLKIRDSETVRKKLNQVEAEALAETARGLQKAGLLKEAYDTWIKVLQKDPTHAEALKFIADYKQADQLQSYIQAGDAAMTQKKWDDAVNSYGLARGMMDATHPQKLRVEAALKKARLESHLGRIHELMDQKNWTAAEDEIAKARQESGDSPELTTLQARIKTLREYYLHFDMGKQFLSDASYIKARAEFVRAQAIMDTAEVHDMTVETDYQRYFSQGKYYFEQKEYGKAVAMCVVARGYKKTAEVDALIAEALRLQKETGGGAKP